MHLLRELEHTEKYKSPGKHWPAFAKRLRRLLGDAVRLWRRRDEISAETCTSRRGRLAARLEELVDTPWADRHAKRLIKRLRRHQNDLFTFLDQPNVPFDNNGSCYISREFDAVLDEHELSHKRTKPHCPEENGLMERANRTIGEALEGEALTDYLQARKVIARVIRWYNEERLHSALGFLRPVDFYRGKPEELYADRRRKLAEARHRRREENLQLRQPMLPLTTEETVA